MNAEESIKEKILKEYENGNVVVMTFEGIQSMPMEDFIKQPVDGMLYDLNRDAATILTFIEDPKWINDYALTTVLIHLTNQKAHQQWTPVEEGLPEDLTREILFMDHDEDCWLDHLNHFSVDIANYCERECVRYWMYRPNPPQK